MTKKAKPSKQKKHRAALSSPVGSSLALIGQYLLQGNYPGAVATCEYALRSLPRYARQRAEVLAHLGTAQGLLQNFPQSYAAFTEAQALDPKDAQLWYNRSMASRFTSRFGQALRDMERAIELNTTRELAEQFEEALQFSRQLAEESLRLRGPSFTLEQLIEQENHFQHGLEWMEAGEWEQAGQAFQASIAMGDCLPQPRGNLGICLLMQERYDEAQTALQRALEIDPKYALAKNNLDALPEGRRTGPPRRVALKSRLSTVSSSSLLHLSRSSDGSLAKQNKKTMTRLGKQPPRYRFFLNPYQDVRFTRCLQCGGKTLQRKLPLVIHVDPMQLVSLNKTCRYCPRCDLLIAYQNEVEQFLAAFFGVQNPEVVGNEYLVIGTLDRPDWKRGAQHALSLQEMLEALHDFKEGVTFKPMMGWSR